MHHPIHHAILGLAVADALGVPVELQFREELTLNPVVGIRGYATHHQPPGTWSDDSSLTFCLADSLCGGYELADIAEKLVAWRKAEIWTPHGKVFDIGLTTQRAIGILAEILATGNVEDLTNLRDEADEYSNGNGSLMRILPLYFAIREYDLDTIPSDWLNALVKRAEIVALCDRFAARY
jgi:ADP-ribosyl-[dinitrogen reductase] hydrolase